MLLYLSNIPGFLPSIERVPHVDRLNQVLEKSSFETLEALGAHLTSTIVKDFKPNPDELFTGEEGWQVKVSMEKPTAVPFADCPVVEVRASAPVTNGNRSHR